MIALNANLLRNPTISYLACTAFILATCLLFLGLPQPAEGRAGGGESYSDDSGDSGSDYSSSNDSSSYSSSDDSSSNSSSNDSSSYSSSDDSGSYGSSNDYSSSNDSGGSGHYSPAPVNSVTTTRTYHTGRRDPTEVPRPAKSRRLGMHLQGSNDDEVSMEDPTPFFLSLVLGFLFLNLIARAPIRSPEVRKEPPKTRPRRENPVQDEGSARDALSALTARDPKFDMAAFLERVKKAFCMIQTAWSEQNLEPVQAFLSDGVFERFSLQIDDLRQDRIKDVMEQVAVLDQKVAQLSSDSHFDTIHVLVSASAVNYRTNLDTGAFLSGSKTADKFSEVWSFIRRLGSKTTGKDGLIEGFCPNCGAPLEISRAASCKACGSFLRSGEYDWVLSEITQISEWKIVKAAEIAGLNAFAASDPGFNVQHIEDRTSVVFWRSIDCWRHGTVEPLKRYSTESFLKEFSKRVAPDLTGSRPSYANAAVGSVEVQVVFPGESMDQVFVEIRWSGEAIEVDSSGKKQKGRGRSRNSHEVFVMKRKHGVQTDTRLSLASATCPGCGAPEESATDNVCPFCNSAYNDGSKEWVLDRILSTNDRDYLASRMAAWKS